jgi:hypothetical protein
MVLGVSTFSADHVDFPASEIHVLPLKPEDLSSVHTRVQSHSLPCDNYT